MKNIFLNLILLGCIILTSCEDDAPGAYKESFIVDALLLVDMPIEGINILRTQAIFDKYIHDSTYVKNAIISIEGDGKIFNLQYRSKDEMGVQGYFATDLNYKVKSNTHYSLKVILQNGDVLTGETTTPERTNWIIKANQMLQYPKDTLKLKATDSIAWAKVANNDFYIISVKCLDTLDYGKYLTPSTPELNRRIYFPLGSESRYKDFTSYSPIANTKTSVVWAAFKWYGLQQVKIFVPDYNFLRWFIQAQVKQEMDPLLSSIKGNAYGFFGSASFISDTTFLLKNQP
ncbi:MAG TPA: hypothetical protein PLE30_10310 [Candidatus Kapabacteria bacterium]|nr:hypothetical protein [Candidatus Kapabacteria bacterium]